MPSHLSPYTHARDPQRGMVVAYVRAGSCALTRTDDLYRPGSLTGSLFYARKPRNMNPTEPRPKNLPTVRPSVRELPADLLTPVGAYLRLREWAGLTNPTEFDHPLMQQPLAYLPPEATLPDPDTPLLDQVIARYRQEFPDLRIPDGL